MNLKDKRLYLDVNKYLSEKNQHTKTVLDDEWIIEEQTVRPTCSSNLKKKLNEKGLWLSVV